MVNISKFFDVQTLSKLLITLDLVLSLFLSNKVLVGYGIIAYDI